MRNTLEKNYEKQLQPLKKRGTSPYRLDYETEQLPYILVKAYIPDFILTFPSGKKRFIEVKGYFRPADRAKMLAVKKMNPKLDIRLVFPYNGKLNKNSKTRYSDWCQKNGFPYAIGDVPKGWLKENG